MSLNDLAFSSNEKKIQRIMRLRNSFNKREVITIRSACAKTGYAESTIIKWCKEGNIPLLQDDGKSIVPLTDENTPKWLQDIQQ